MSECVKSKVSSGIMDVVSLLKGLVCLVGRNLNSGDTVKRNHHESRIRAHKGCVWHLVIVIKKPVIKIVF